MKNFKQLLAEKMRDPEFAREYEILSEELDLAVQIAKRREQLGLTQQMLAERTGIKQPMLARIEKGQVPTVFTLQRIALALESRIIIDSELRIEPKDGTKPTDYVYNSAFDVAFSELIRAEEIKYSHQCEDDATFSRTN